MIAEVSVGKSIGSNPAKTALSESEANTLCWILTIIVEFLTPFMILSRTHCINWLMTSRVGGWPSSDLIFDRNDGDIRTNRLLSNCPARMLKRSLLTCW